MQKIAILATGNELVNGEIDNTNTKFIAEKLVSNGFLIGFHLIVSDNQLEIECALRFLSSTHDIVIVTGGLGPTSDDRTRFAASKVTESPLVFNEENWQSICAYITKLLLPIPECNRQQAFYPKDSEIIPNAIGTAAGFSLQHQKTRYFFLPGPPKECLTMFESFILPALIVEHQQEKMFHKYWRLFGVNEGEIAAKLDEALKSYPLETGYRFDYPYLEFKIRTHEESLLRSITPLIEDFIRPHLLSHHEIPASVYLHNRLINLQNHLIIQDEATGGLLQTRLLSPKTRHNVSFQSFNTFTLAEQEIGIVIQGLDELWQEKIEPGKTELIIHFYHHQQTFIEKSELPYRQNRIRLYALEFIAHRINQFLNQHVCV